MRQNRRFAQPCLKYRQLLGVVIKQQEGAADRPTGQQVAGLVFLKGSRTASDQQPSGLLRKTKLFANPPNLLRTKQPFATGFKPVQHPVVSHLADGLWAST